jgi:hypothetical protein
MRRLLAMAVAAAIAAAAIHGCSGGCGAPDCCDSGEGSDAGVDAGLPLGRCEDLETLWAFHVPTLCEWASGCPPLPFDLDGFELSCMRGDLFTDSGTGCPSMGMCFLCCDADDRCPRGTVCGGGAAIGCDYCRLCARDKGACPQS